MSDPQFMLHNSHLEGPDFDRLDPQLRALKTKHYAYLPPLVAELPFNIPGIYTVTGGRQIGKTTLAKQWMQHLLNRGVAPKSIVYFTGEIIVDHLSLIRQLQTYIQNMPQDTMRYVIVDEITYISNWDMGIKFLADAGVLENVVLLITGSDSTIIQEAKMRFPGRRGKANKVDFHVYPLSFYETLTLTQCIDNLDSELQSTVPSEKLLAQLDGAFKNYMIHGGFLTAINDFAQNSVIAKSTLDTYADWIRGDMIKRGKNDHHCKAFFTAMLKRLSSQITWAALAKDFAIEHHGTIADYAALLMSMDAIFIQQSLLEDKLIGAPKKARKLIFTDPFIYHSIYAWLNPQADPFKQQILLAIYDSQIASYLVEAIVASHLARWYPTYYINATGEVDVAYIKNNKFWPIEIKWTEQLRSKDLKQIQKYKNGIILGKQHAIRQVGEIPSYPLAWYLARLSKEHHPSCP